MKRLKNTLTERHLVVVLFILVLITFSLAQRDSKRLQYLYTLTQAQKANVALDQKAVLPSILAK